MGDAGYRGVSADQDSRFANKDRKLIRHLESSKLFPPSFSKKVDLRKVNLEVMKPWVEAKTQELLGFEDEVVVEYVMGMLESEENQPNPNPRQLQLSLTGFLESSTPRFMAELWDLLLSAQESIGGIPQQFVDKKKEEMRAARERDAAAIRNSGIPGSGNAAIRMGSRFDASIQPGHGAALAAPNLPARPPIAGPRGGGDREFRDKRGVTTPRVQDSGWGGSRHGATDRTATRDPDRYASSSYSHRRNDDRGARHDLGRSAYHRRDGEDEYSYSRRRPDDYDRDRYDSRRISRRDSRERSPPRRRNERARDPTRSPSRSLSFSRSPSPPARLRRHNDGGNRYETNYRRGNETVSRRRDRSETQSITPPRSKPRLRSRRSYSSASSRSPSRSRSPSPPPRRRSRGDGEEYGYHTSYKRKSQRSYASVSSRSLSHSRSPSRSTSPPPPAKRRIRHDDCPDGHGSTSARMDEANSRPRRKSRSITPLTRAEKKRSPRRFSYSDLSRSTSRSLSQSATPPPPPTRHSLSRGPSQA